VLEGVAFVPQFYRGGAVNVLFDHSGAPARVQVRVKAPA
jgi:hypothetical protein